MVIQFILTLIPQAQINNKKGLLIFKLPFHICLVIWLLKFEIHEFEIVINPTRCHQRTQLYEQINLEFYLTSEAKKLLNSI